MSYLYALKAHDHETCEYPSPRRQPSTHLSSTQQSSDPSPFVKARHPVQQLSFSAFSAALRENCIYALCAFLPAPGLSRGDYPSIGQLAAARPFPDENRYSREPALSTARSGPTSIAMSPRGSRLLNMLASRTAFSTPSPRP